MNKDFIEIIAGFFVILICIAAVFFAFEKNGNNSTSSKESYQINAAFENAGGISIGTDVRIAGVKVGRVINFSLDPKYYQAITTMMIQKDVHIPMDSSAKIMSNGLVGDRYISISPGTEEEFLTNGSTLQFTQSSLSFEELLGKLIFGLANNDKKDDAKK